jgi:hypothetical protein
MKIADKEKGMNGRKMQCLELSCSRMIKENDTIDFWWL